MTETKPTRPPDGASTHPALDALEETLRWGRATRAFATRDSGLPQEEQSRYDQTVQDMVRAAIPALEALLADYTALSAERDRLIRALDRIGKFAERGRVFPECDDVGTDWGLIRSWARGAVRRTER